MKLFSFIAILLLASLALAQPQAPVIWGEPQWLDFPDNPSRADQIVPMGDTLIFCGTDPSATHTYVSHSFDNGLTISAWQQLSESLVAVIRMSGSAGRVYVCIYDGYGASMRISTDAGLTWGGTVAYRLAALYHSFASNLNVLRVTESSESLGTRWASWSSDGGQNWSSDYVIDPLPYQISGYSPIGFTRDRMILLGTGYQVDDRLSYVATASNGGAAWVPFTLFPAQPAGGNPADLSVTADTATGNAVVLMLKPGFGILARKQPWIYHTDDGGQSWAGPQALADTSVIWPLYAGDIFSAGPLVGAAWSTPIEGDTLQRLCWRFSANHGQNWYPEQEVLDSVYQVDYSTGQFTGDDVWVYWRETTYYPSPAHAFRMMGATVESDVFPPVILPISLPPDTVEVNSEQLFLASITDNDTLSREELVIREGDSTTAIPMEWTGSDYLAHWTVPHEGRFFYCIEGEDFWENIGSYPDSGWAMLVTPGWVDEAEDGRTAVRGYGLLSVYPNPFNSSTTLSLDLPVSGRVEMVLYDVTGRRIQTLVDQLFTSGSHTLTVRGEGLGSGIYFVRMHAGRQSATCKVMVLK